MYTEPLYQKIYRDLHDGIVSGKYRVGDRLPSEKELADSYDVSRITSKKALETLADRGYVMRKPGKGTFVIEIPRPVNELEADDLDINAGRDENRPCQLIGVIMDSFGATFGPELIRGLEYECRRRGYMLLLRFTYGSMEQETQALNDMLSAGVAGIIIMCTQGETYNSDILKLQLADFPLIFLDRGLQGIPVPVVTTDNYGAGRELTEHLLAKGHTRICFLSHSHVRTTTVADRFSGYLNAMSAHGLVNDPSLWLRNLDACLPNNDEDTDTDNTDEASMRILSEYVDEHPDVTGFIAVEFSLAAMLFRVLKEKDMVGEKDIAYFDGYESDELVIPPYAHILQDQYQMGVTAVSMLVRKGRGDEVASQAVIPHIMITE